MPSTPCLLLLSQIVALLGVIVSTVVYPALQQAFQQGLDGDFSLLPGSKGTNGLVNPSQTTAAPQFNVTLSVTVYNITNAADYLADGVTPRLQELPLSLTYLRQLQYSNLSWLEDQSLLAFHRQALYTAQDRQDDNGSIISTAALEQQTVTTINLALLSYLAVPEVQTVFSRVPALQPYLLPTAQFVTLSVGQLLWGYEDSIVRDREGAGEGWREGNAGNTAQTSINISLSILSSFFLSLALHLTPLPSSPSSQAAAFNANKPAEFTASLPSFYPGLLGTLNTSSPASAASGLSSLQYRLHTKGSLLQQLDAYASMTSLRCCYWGYCSEAGAGAAAVGTHGGYPWNGQDANLLSGSAGLQFKMDVKPSSILRLAAYDYGVQRHFDLRMASSTGPSDYAVQDIQLYRFETQQAAWATAAESPDGAVYNNYGYGGLLNQSSCSNSAPVWMSFPRFLFADSALRHQGIEGIPPADPSQHGTWLGVEPTTGAVLDLHLRFGFNAQVPNYALRTQRVGRQSGSSGSSSARFLQKSSRQREGALQKGATAGSSRAASRLLQSSLAESFIWPVAWASWDAALSADQQQAFFDRYYLPQRLMLACLWGGYAVAGLCAVIVAAIWTVTGIRKWRQRGQGGAGAGAAFGALQLQDSAPMGREDSVHIPSLQENLLDEQQLAALFQASKLPDHYNAEAQYYAE